MQEGIIQTRGKALLIEELDQEDETDQELPCEQGVVELGDDSGGEEGLILVTRKILR
jgi:hypothetical protein